MSSRFRTTFGWLARAVPTLLVLGGLVFVARWGDRNNWKLPSLAALRGQEEEPAPKKKEQEDDGPIRPGPVSLSSDEAADRAGIETAPAQRETIRREVTAPAALAFDQTRYAHLSPRASGTAWRVLKQPGNKVRAGEVLALIATPELARIKADFITAFIQTDLKQKAYDRARGATALPERQVREAEQALREARAGLLNARQALANLDLPVSLTALKGLSDEEVNDRLRALGLPSEIAAERDVPGHLLPIVAPFDGEMVRRDLVAGETASPSTMAFVVADLSRLWVMLDVRQEDAAGLTEGQEVRFTGRATNRASHGSLKWISPEVDPKTRTVRARAVIDNAGGLRPATFGTARVLLTESPAVTVPHAAIQFDGKSYRVFVRVDAKTYEPRLVLPGARVNGRTELLDTGTIFAASLLGQAGSGALPALGWLSAREALAGVRPGDAVVTTGSHVLKSEMFRARISGDED